jgi:hypothetical protein
VRGGHLTDVGVCVAVGQVEAEEALFGFQDGGKYSLPVRHIYASSTHAFRSQYGSSAFS